MRLGGMMKKLIALLLVVIATTTFDISPHAKTKLVSTIRALIGNDEDTQLYKQLLLLLHQYCTIQKELVTSLYIPETKKKEFTQQILEKKSEIDSFFARNQDNTCFVNKTFQGLQAFELHILNQKIKIVDTLLNEIK